jgi:RpiB/LacA/LacB family sugar-phosphate isomerase
MAVIAVAADHAGFALKEELKAWLSTLGYGVLDFGTHSSVPVDYPDYALHVAEAVAAGSAARGVLVCGTGVGMAMAANKVPGIRAAACVDVHVARLSREHNDTNVLALGARLSDRAQAREILGAWLETAFAGGRHRRRLEKLTALEQVHAGTR